MKRIAIIGAMEEEVNQLKERMEISGTEQIASMEFVKGLLEGREVVVVRCGIGKVNAAICTQVLADRYQVDGIINTGVAIRISRYLPDGSSVEISLFRIRGQKNGLSSSLRDTARKWRERRSRRRRGLTSFRF